MLASSRWFHANISGKDAETKLLQEGIDGSFLARPSSTAHGDYVISVRRKKEVTHIRVRRDGSHYVWGPGEERFASLQDIFKYCMENLGLRLKDTNGGIVELKQPLPCSEPTSERWFHGGISGSEAEKLLRSRGKAGSFLVRESTRQLENYVLSVMNEAGVAHFSILRRNDGRFEFGEGSPIFHTVDELIDHFRRNGMIDRDGNMIQLKQPCNATRFIASSIKSRIEQLMKKTENEGLFGSGNGFWEEFESLATALNDFSSARHAGSLQENRYKNRFREILPYDSTRVILHDCNPKQIGDDYINASYVKPAEPMDKVMTYIATQGCMPNTVNEFWKMVWQENTRIIVMTTREEERGRPRCFQYWPSPKENSTYGYLSIRCTKDDVFADYVLRRLEVEHCQQPNLPRIVYQYHFTSWPDHGVPEDPGRILSFLEEINRCQDDIPEAGPIVVHCSAGVGRSGTFIAIDMILNQIDRFGLDTEIDIHRLVKNLREQRTGMVQTETQYKFIYTSVNCYVETTIRRMHDGSGDTRYLNILNSPASLAESTL